MNALILATSKMFFAKNQESENILLKRLMIILNQFYAKEAVLTANAFLNAEMELKKMEKSVIFQYQKTFLKDIQKTQYH